MTTESAKLVDIADPPTWPAEVSDLVDELVDEVRATDGFHPEIPACDLPSLVGTTPSSKAAFAKGSESTESRCTTGPDSYRMNSTS